MANDVTLRFVGESTSAVAAGDKTAASIKAVGVVAAKTAEQQVAAAATQRESLIKIQAQYAELAAAAEKGSAAQIAAARLATDAQKKLDAQIVTSAKTAGSAAEGAAVKTKEASASMAGSMLKMAAGFVGLTIGVKVLSDIAHAGEGAVAANKLLESSLNNLGISYSANIKEIDGFIGKLSSLAGFTKTDLTNAFTHLVSVTHDVNKAQADLGVAADLARYKQIGLTQATQLLIKAQEGNVAGLKRMGIVVAPVTDAMDKLKAEYAAAAAAAKAHGDAIEKLPPALVAEAKAADGAATAEKAVAAVHKLTAGAAAEATTATDHLKTTMENAAASIGTKVVGAMDVAAAAVEKFIGQWDTAGTSANHLHEAVDIAVGSIKAVAGVADGAAKALGGWKTVIEGVATAFGLWKLVELGGMVATFGKTVFALVGNFALVGAAAEANAAGVEVSVGAMSDATLAASIEMRAALISTGFGALAVAAGIAAVEIIKHWSTVKVWMSSFKDWMVTWGPLILAPLTFGLSLAVAEIIKHFNSVKAFFVAFGKDFAELFTHPIAAVEKMFKLMAAAIEKVFAAIVNQIGDILSKIPTSIMGIHIPGMSQLHSFAETMKNWQASGTALGKAAGEAAAATFASSSSSVSSLGALGNATGTAPDVKGPGGVIGKNRLGAVSAATISSMLTAAGYDAQAVMGIASNEGMSGKVGDQGHAFGPFQLNNAGGVLTGMFPGATEAQLNAWAWSKAGIAWAIAHAGSSKGAAGKGLTGKAAVDAWTKNFERPKNPSADLAAGYAAVGYSGTATTPTPTFTTTPSPSTVSAAASLAAQVKAATSTLKPLIAELNNDVAKTMFSPDVAAELKAHAKTITDALNGATKADLPGIKKNLADLKANIQDGLAQALDSKKILVLAKNLTEDLKQGLLPKSFVTEMQANLKAWNATLADGLISDETRKQIEAKIAAATKSIHLKLAEMVDFKTIKVDNTALVAAVADGVFPPALAKTLEAEGAKLKKALADAYGNADDTAAVHKLITAHDKNVQALIKAFAASNQFVTDELAGIGATLLSDAIAAGTTLAHLFTPAEITGVGAQIAALNATLKKTSDPATQAAIEKQITALTGTMDTGLQQMVQTINDDRQKVAQAWTDFGSLVDKTFKTDVYDKFQNGLDSVNSLLASDSIAQAIIDDQAALAAAIKTGGAGNDTIVAAMNDQIKLWQQYYADLEAGNFDGAKALVAGIVADQEAVKTGLAALTGDQATAAQSVVDAGNQLISDIKAQGDPLVQAAVKNWQDLSTAQQAAIDQAIKDAQARVDSGAEPIGAALDDLKQVFIANGLSPDEANGLLADPITGSLTKAVAALALAVQEFTILFGQLETLLAHTVLYDPTEALAGSMVKNAGIIVSAAGTILRTVGTVDGVPVVDVTDPNLAATLAALNPSGSTSLGTPPAMNLPAGWISSSVSPPPPPAGGSCFVGETQVAMPGGSRRIDEILVGDTVLVHDFTLGQLVPTKVEEVQVHRDDDARTVLEITAGGHIVQVTAEHPFWNGQEWVPAGSLRPGAVVAAAAGGSLTSVTVMAVRTLPGLRAVYNLHVAHDDHNYVANGFLVHNVKMGGFASGGVVGAVARAYRSMIVPGPPSRHDNQLISAASGEMVINGPQQAHLWNLISGGAPSGGGYDLSRLERKLEQLQQFLATRDGISIPFTFTQPPADPFPYLARAAQAVTATFAATSPAPYSGIPVGKS